VLQLRQLQQATVQRQNLSALFKSLAIWPKRQPLYQAALQRLSLNWLDYLLQELAAFDRLYKSGQLSNTDVALAHLVTLFIKPVPKAFSLQLQAGYD